MLLKLSCHTFTASSSIFDTSDAKTAPSLKLNCFAALRKQILPNPFQASFRFFPKIKANTRAEQHNRKPKSYFRTFCQFLSVQITASMSRSITKWIVFALISLISFTYFDDIHFFIVLYFSFSKLSLHIYNFNLSLPPIPFYEVSFIQLFERKFAGERRPLRLNCSSCAIVFSSGHLINSSAGAEIDSHQCVGR